jgi:hypothetical protein
MLKYGPRSFLGAIAMVLYYELYLYAERDHLTKWGSDKFFVGQSIVAPLFSVGVVYTILSTFPYTLFPALVGKTGRGFEVSVRKMFLEQSGPEASGKPKQ